MLQQVMSACRKYSDIANYFYEEMSIVVQEGKLHEDVLVSRVVHVLLYIVTLGIFARGDNDNVSRGLCDGCSGYFYEVHT